MEGGSCHWIDLLRGPYCQPQRHAEDSYLGVEKVESERRASQGQLTLTLAPQQNNVYGSATFPQRGSQELSLHIFYSVSWPLGPPASVVQIPWLLAPLPRELLG